MRTQRMPWAVPLLLAWLMLGMSLSMFVQAPETALSDENTPLEVGLNEPTSVSIQVADGSSSALKAEIPMGHTVESIDLSLSPDALAYSDGFSWSGESDWNASGAMLDKINVNISEGMQLLPQEWVWDFENSNQGWSLQSSGGWARGYDSTLGASNGVHGGTKAIYTYNGNYPNYMSGTHWATSPAIDCSGCSGAWNLQYWKRLGVEYHYYDHAYVQVKNAQGSWVQIYSNVGSVSDSSYQLVTHNVANYVQNNPAFQVRFGLGSTDGSVTYTGWNVDDVSISPAGGGGGGEEANWTSARFGPGITGAHGMEGARYGITSIDATIPNGADLRLSVLDGVSKTPIPGFSNLEPTWVDLGSIDPEKHPSLSLKLYFDARGGALSPIVHEIHMNHRYGTSFGSNPTDAGWSMSGMNWNNGQISGSNGATATSPVFTSHRAITQMQFSTSTSGSYNLEASVDGGTWQSVSASGITAFSEFGSTLQIRITCNGSCSISELTLEILGGHLPTDPRFDIGQDGWSEWEMTHPHVSNWGWQDRFTNGDLSSDMSWTTPGLKQVGLLLPKSGLESFSVDLAPFSSTNPVDVSLSIGGTTIGAKTVSFSTQTESYTLSPSEILSLNSELVNTSTFWGVGSDVEYAIVTIDVTLSNTPGYIRVGGLSAIHRPSADLSFAVESAFVMSMNQALPSAQIQSQHHMVPLTLQSSTPGSYIGTITDLVTSENVHLDAALISNFTQWAPVAPSWQWMELGLNYSWGDGTPSHLSVNVETDGARAFYEFPVDGSTYSMTRMDGASTSPLQFKDANGGAIFNQGNQNLGVVLPFQTSANLDDSNQFKISASLYMSDGAPSPSHIEIAGQSSQGVENDVEIRSWQVLNELGYTIPESMSYLRSNSSISVEVFLGFEGLSSVFGQEDATTNPRSGDVRVHLLENGVEKLNTTTVDEGMARFGFNTQSGTGNATYSIEVEPLAGQEFSSAITMNRTFTVDSLNPQVIGQNIAQFDHRTPSSNQLIQLEIYDRPVLPTDLTLMIWREWVDDTNVNGEIDADEFTPMSLQTPSNLTSSSGDYTLLLDDTAANDGDLVAGYVVGADPAGNTITDGGSSGESSQLFTYQVLPDGPPLLPGEGGFTNSPDGRQSYLHPGVDYEFGLHITEPNGWADIGELRLQLASNSVSDTLAIEWSAADGQCNVLSPHLNVERCGVRAWSGELTPFNPDLEFYVEFQLNWSLPREGDMRWEPSIEVTDRSGQGAWLSLPQLRWRYSPDLAIDTEDLTLSIGTGTYSDEGAWVSPSSTIALTGGIHFPVTGARPSEDFSVRVLLDGQESLIQSSNGLWAIQLSAPTESGSYPLTVEIANPPDGANDVTDTAAALRWIVVDPEGPEVVAIHSPRLDSILPIDALGDLQIDVQISELEQIDTESLVLHWKVIRGMDATAIPLVYGESPLTIEGGNLAGQSIIAGATLDISDSIPEEYYSDILRFHIWIEGQDMAGNPVQTPLDSNLEDNPFASWAIERRAAVFEVVDGDITYSKSGDIDAGENVMVTVAVRNDGDVDGTVRLFLTEVHLDGSTHELTAIALEQTIPAGERGLVNMDWVPSENGRQWIRVTMEDGTIATGPTLNVVEEEDSGFIGSIFGGVDLVWALLFVGLILLLASVLMIALRSGGSNTSYLDESDDYWEDEDEVNILPSGSKSEEPKGFPLDYRDETVRHVMAQHGISDTIGFLQHARGFDKDGNEYLNKSELDQAAASFVAAGSLVEAQVGSTQTFDPSTMSAEQLEWYEQAKQWGGYYDEAGNWIEL